jgi:tetratricopeptide (TPR) repeat protein
MKSVGNYKGHRHYKRLSLVIIAVLAFSLVAAETAETLERGADFARLRLELRRDPTDVDRWLLLAQSYLEADYYQEARDAFVEAAALDYLLAEAHFGLGLAEYALGNYSAALFSFDELVRLHPERFDGHFNRAVTLSRLRQHEAAARAFEEAIAHAEPTASREDLLNAYIGLAGQLTLLGDFDGAVAAYDGVLELAPEPEFAFLRAETLTRGGRGLEALPGLSELERELQDYRVSSLMADVYLEAGRSDYALQSLRRALRRAATAGDDPAIAETQFRLGLLYRELGRDPDAVVAFQAAILAEPDLWQAHYNLGLTYLDAAQAHNALASFERALALTPEAGEVYLAMAVAEERLGRSDEALVYAVLAQEVLALPELRAEASFIEARARYLTDDFLGAELAIDEVLAVYPESAEAYLWAGLIQYERGNYEAAAQFYEGAVQLDPGDTVARTNLGAAYLAAARYGDAELVYALLIQEDPANAEAHYNLGWALLLQGRREDAREAWQQAVALGYTEAQADLREHF